MAQRGITVSYETIRQWCQTFDAEYARALRRHRGRMGDTWYLDELFVNIQGRQQYLWRAVDEDGDVTDILVQSRRDRRAATRFFRKLLKGQGCVPRRLIADKLRGWPPDRHAVGGAQDYAIREQSSGSLPSTDSATRATNETIQVR